MNNSSKNIRYMALGDSYTICEGATWEQSWPVNLVKNLNQQGIAITLVANPSVTGWTAQQLIDNELPVFDAGYVDFVTLLIGVNDWVQEVSIAEFHRRLMTILNHLQHKLTKKNNILLITIPDFGCTPNGPQYSKGRDITAGISAFNGIIKEEAASRQLKVVDIFPVTQAMKDAPQLVSADGLHPSAEEYNIWEKMITPVAHAIISNQA